jgi:hypothetical protein
MNGLGICCIHINEQFRHLLHSIIYMNSSDICCIYIHERFRHLLHSYTWTVQAYERLRHLLHSYTWTVQTSVAFIHMKSLGIAAFIYMNGGGICCIHIHEQFRHLLHSYTWTVQIYVAFIYMNSLATWCKNSSDIFRYIPMSKSRRPQHSCTGTFQTSVAFIYMNRHLLHTYTWTAIYCIHIHEQISGGKSCALDRLLHFNQHCQQRKKTTDHYQFYKRLQPLVSRSMCNQVQNSPDYYTLLPHQQAA